MRMSVRIGANVSVSIRIGVNVRVKQEKEAKQTD